MPQVSARDYYPFVVPSDIAGRVARALKLAPSAVESTLRLLNDGHTVPFIARYRKEATGALDEVQVRDIQARSKTIAELEERRAAILASIQSQDKLTPELAAQIRGAGSKQALEDLYLPYRPKRRTRASMARDRGLQGLAERILRQDRDGDPVAVAAAFVGPDVRDPDAALAGARDIVAEAMAENPSVRALGRRSLFQHGRLEARAASKAAQANSKYQDYFDFESPLAGVPSHRYLALCRGESEKELRVTITTDHNRLVQDIEPVMGLDRRSPWRRHMRTAIEDGVARLLLPSLVTELRSALKARADDGAVDVFAENLRNLLMAAPLGARPVVGLDPGIRTGHKLAAVDATGQLLGHTVIHVRQPTDEPKAADALVRFVRTHGPSAIAVGNGTGGREAERFVRKTLTHAGLADVMTVSVNEAGASVYSASDEARKEFPELDLTVRGAISIARRLQDPLAELVKIDPKSVGVGQYQHDVQQTLLQAKLQEVVEDCVHSVGVDLNTASPQLLRHVSGIGPKLAERIVEHRHDKGPFATRRELTKVAGLGPRAFELAAGFLRIHEGRDPLDESAVHPERYALVAQIARDAGVKVGDLVGNADAVDQIPWETYVSDDVGRPTLRDIADELKRPGRDPRDRFEAPKFADGIERLDDVKEGMRLDGVVTNVTKFGAFVDVGVHQDGLVHVSELADRFVNDPSEVVRVGDRVRVRVLSVDLARQRLGLSIKQA